MTTFRAYAKALDALFHAHELTLSWNRAAPAKQLHQVEQTIGHELPKALASVWATANGTKRDEPVFARPGYLTPYTLLSTMKALAERDGLERRAPRYAEYVEPSRRDRRIAPGWFQPGWLPFASFSGATMLLIIDFSPSARGAMGQVIAFTHDPDEMSYVAPSFDHFLRASLKFFKAEADELLSAFD